MLGYINQYWETRIHQVLLRYCAGVMKVKRAIETDPILSKHLQIIGDPIGSVISFQLAPQQSGNLSIYEISDLLTKRLAFCNFTKPISITFAFTRLTVPVVDELIADLVEATKEAVAIAEEHKRME